jgi:hypothetical protein
MTNMLNTTTVQALSFLLFLAALPLISFGTMEDQQLLWYAGLVLLLIAGILPPLGRFVIKDEDEDEDEAAADDTDGKAADDKDDQGGDDQADEADEADEADDDSDGEVTTDVPHSAGPIGRGTGSAGREQDRQRVQEQAERSSGEDDR